MPRLKIKNLGNLQIDSEIKPDTDYAITLRVAREGKYLPDSHGEETGSETYSTKVIQVELIQEIGASKEIDFKQIKTDSKELRDLIWRLGNKRGETDDEAFYKKIMAKFKAKVGQWIEESQ